MRHEGVTLGSGNQTWVDPLGFAADIKDEIRLSRDSANALHPDSHVESWVAAKLKNPHLDATPIPLSRLSKWRINPASGNIEHESGMFFSIIGLSVRHRTNKGLIVWDQPIIDQPEIGILGILAKKINGILHFCLQAKEEPGNINSIQLSPTVQATYSNYSRVHGGKSTAFLEHFLTTAPEQFIYAKLQTEDGGRFLYKSNRNMIVLMDQDEPIDLPPEFIWLTLRQICLLMKHNNLIHACTRSILSSTLLPANDATIPYSPDFKDSLASVFQWLDEQKARNHFLVNRENLKSLREWQLDDDGYFSQEERRFFKVIGIDISTSGREVPNWTQPILVNPESGIIGMLMQRKNNQRYFLMQAKAEVGNRTVVQLGPTIQFTSANYIGNRRLAKPFLCDEFTSPKRFSLICENYQSEEGARFFKETHLHRVLEIPQGEELVIPASYHWVSESALRFFLHAGEQVNSCARSIIACLIGNPDDL